MSAPATPPIIVIKKKGHHGGHHGGAWKVAYADFVTAMMALFIVLWLMNASQEVQKAIAGYFRDPRGSDKKAGSSYGGNGESLSFDKNNLDKLKNTLEQALRETPKFEKLKNNVKMTVTGEGLRIELLENEKGVFFDNGQAKPTEAGKELLIELAHELGKMPNGILVEGHTDAKPFDREGYSNWELSADRANMSRRIMQENGLRADQISQVRGFADQQLRLPDKPDDPSNRRISIIVRFSDGTPIPTESNDKSVQKAALKPGLAPSANGLNANKSPAIHH